MSHETFVDQTLNNLLKHAHERNITKTRLHGGHLEVIKPQVKQPIIDFMKHLEGKVNGDKGVVHQGGSLQMGGHFAGHIPKDPKDAYHYALNLTPQQLEMKREIASQLLGGVPSPMWGNLIDKEDKLETDPEDYEKVIEMPNVHSMARMIEAEDGYSKGGGFWKAVKHIGKKMHNWYQMGHAALGFVGKIKDPLLETSLLSPYKDTINSAYDTLNAMDQTVNPIVDSTVKAMNGDETERQRIKDAAYNALQNTAISVMPSSKPYIEAANHLSQVMHDKNNEKRPYTKPKHQDKAKVMQQEPVD